MDPTAEHLNIRGFRALIPHSSWSALLLQGTRRTFTAGDRILDQGAPSRLVHVVLEGRVRVVYTEPDGHEVLIAIRGPGDLVGEYAQRDQGEHMATVWTLERCTASVLSSQAFEAAVRSHRLDDPLQHYVLQKYRQVPQRLWYIANLRVEQRMALLFLEIVNADPSAKDASIPLTQVQVAESLGVTRSSVTRVLAHWKEARLIELRPSRIDLLDLAALARLSSRQ